VKDNCKNVDGVEMIEGQLVQEINKNCPEKLEEAVGAWNNWKQKNEVTVPAAMAWYEAWAAENQCGGDPWAKIEMELQEYIMNNCPDQANNALAAWSVYKSAETEADLKRAEDWLEKWAMNNNCLPLE